MRLTRLGRRAIDRTQSTCSALQDVREHQPDGELGEGPREARAEELVDALHELADPEGRGLRESLARVEVVRSREELALG